MPPSQKITHRPPSSSSEAKPRANAPDPWAGGWGWMIPLLLLVAWAGLRGAGADALWYDEWWSVYYAGAAAQYPDVSVAQTWGRVAAEFHELNPPGYYMVLNLWGRAVGGTPLVLRGWSVLMGLVAVAAVYRLATDLYSRQAGLLAAGGLAVSAFFVVYTHEARAYMQLAALTALTVWVYWRLMSGQETPRWFYGLLWVGVTGLLYTHYMAVMTLAALGLYHLVIARKTRRWWIVCGVVLLAGAAFLPWALRAAQALSQVDNDSARDFFALAPLTVMTRTLNQFSNGSALLVAVVVGFALPRGRLVAWLALMTLILASVANIQIGFLTNVHYLLAVFPLLAVLVGGGLAAFPRGRYLIAGGWAVVGLWLIVFPAPPEPEVLRRYIPWDDVLTVVEPHTARYDTLAFLAPQPDPGWIHQPVADFYAAASPLAITVIESPPNKTPNEFRGELQHLATTQDRLWIGHDTRANYAPSPHALGIRNWLVEYGDLLNCDYRLQMGNVAVDLYASRPRPGWVQPLEGGLAVGTHQWQPARTDAGDLTFFVITERAENIPPHTYSVSVQLSPAGEEKLVYQQDFPLPDTPQACRLVRFPLEELPSSGDYEVYAVVYNWATGERAPLQATGAGRVILFDISF